MSGEPARAEDERQLPAGPLFSDRLAEVCEQQGGRSGCQDGTRHGRRASARPDAGKPGGLRLATGVRVAVRTGGRSAIRDSSNRMLRGYKLMLTT
jgi:hypothetical protein